MLEGLTRPYILDVGGGNDPFPLANIVLDKYPGDTIHRRYTDRFGETHAALVIGDRRFIEADVEALPFLDKSIDYIWCSHVLEHIERPLIAIRELCRVGISGCLIVPHIAQEALFHRIWHGAVICHRWVCWRDARMLYFVRCDTSDKAQVESVLAAWGMNEPNGLWAYTELRLHWGPEADCFKDGISATTLVLKGDTGEGDAVAETTPPVVC